MTSIEQENFELIEEVLTLRAQVEKMSAQMTQLMAERNQPPLHPPHGDQMVVTSAPSSAATTTMPEGFPWSAHVNTGQASRPFVSEDPILTTLTQPGVTQVTAPLVFAPPKVNAITYDEGQIYHSGSMDGHDQTDEIREQLDELKQEVKTLRGKELFGRDARDLCLVPNVRIPPKFKVPDFEKYQGNTCPRNHLVMYVRKMSAYSNDQDLLIHFFQESLTGVAIRWYMDLDNTKIRTFHDLGEAFVQQYKYNLDLAPDRDQLRAMAQKKGESFKEYAQRWREVAAQIKPPPEEKELTKIFLETLDAFYYNRMVASAPSDFTEMVNMGGRLEEGVRKGRLVREDAPINNTKKFGREEQEVSMVAQQPYQQQHPRQWAPRKKIDPIPMKYADLLPILLE